MWVLFISAIKSIKVTLDRPYFAHTIDAMLMVLEVFTRVGLQREQAYCFFRGIKPKTKTMKFISQVMMVIFIDIKKAILYQF